MIKNKKKNRGAGLAVPVIVAIAAGAGIYWYLNQKPSPPPPSGCSANSDCPSGYACVSGTCQPLTSTQPSGTVSISVQSSRLGTYQATSGPTIYPSPSNVIAHVTVTSGFPLPTASVLFEVAGPDLNNPSPTNYLAQTPQTSSSLQLNSPQNFKLTLSNVGYYNIRVTVTLSNSLGNVTLGPQIINIGVGSPPTGTIS